MLKITVGSTDVFDEDTQEFRAEGGVELRLEHSLVSLSKWEAIHEKPFLSDDAKTSEEVFSYIECMVIGENPPREILLNLSEENVKEINAYIDAKMTATWFSENSGGSRGRETITSELIYYWLTVFQIPFECETWHLNRLFVLIRICNIKQSKPKQMSKSEAIRQQRELNAQRRKQFNTTG